MAPRFSTGRSTTTETSTVVEAPISQEASFSTDLSTPLELATTEPLEFASSENVPNRPFVKGNLIGQLGNQMFIIATAYSLALDHDAEAVFPSLKSNPNCNIPLNYQKVFFRLNTQIPEGEKEAFVYQEPKFRYVPIDYHPNMELKGHYQSYKYFDHHRAEILALFAPSEEIQEYLSSKYQDILDDPKTVGIHVRHYSEMPNEAVFPACTREYLEKAINMFPEDSTFVVFTNDWDFTKPRIEGLAQNIVFIKDEPHYIDLYLMSQCKHAILSNSAFGWWAAYLNSNPKKMVVAPRQWFASQSGIDASDLCPEEWIKID